MSGEKGWPESYPENKRAPELEKYLRARFPRRFALKDKGLCPQCQRPVSGQSGFRDELSWKEFLITGLCQGCQDGLFGDEEG